MRTSAAKRARGKGSNQQPKPSRSRVDIPRTITEKFALKGGLRAIQVKVAFGLSKKQKKYLEWWSRRGTYGRGIIQKLSPRVFELPPNALSLYLLARLRENIGEAFLHVYPVGFSSDVPSPPKPVTELFWKQKLRGEELIRLRDLSLREY